MHYNLTILFLFIGLMQVSTSVYSQTTKLTLEMRNKKVVEVLEEIEKQSEFRFAYSSEYFDMNREVTVELNEKSIDETLQALFAGTGVKYAVNDRHILLYLKELESETQRDPRSDQWKLTLFVDWYSVWPGAVGYDAHDEGRATEVPHGVRLEVQEAETYGAGIQADQPWESDLGFVCVLRTEAGFKMWYTAYVTVRNKKTGQAEKDVAFDPMAGEFESVKKLQFICYAESDDGFTWRKPELGLHTFAGSTANNIVLTNSFDNVFHDRDGGYRMLFHGDPIPGGRAIWAAMYSRTSQDGIHWTQDDTPVLDMLCDTQNTGFYDVQLGKYVLYVRCARSTRRTTGMTEGPEFRNLPRPRIVFEPDAQDAPSLDFYTNAYSRHPKYWQVNYPSTPTGMGRLPLFTNHDARDMHFMFPAIYHRDRDVLDVHLAVSRDGRQWNRPERKAVIPLGPDGSGASGSLYASAGIHVLKPGLWGVLYTAEDGLHNRAFSDPNRITKTTYRWATWKENRLVALRADAEGMCTVTLHGHASREICFNYATEQGGWIRAELISNKGLWPPTGPERIAGYTFADCEPLSGDSLSQAVTWNGSSVLPQTSDKDDTVLRLHMFRAKLFAIEWK